MNANEYPLLMKPEMIRAYQDGRKTQTRRLVKGVLRDNTMVLRRATKTRVGIAIHVMDAPERGLCPYGQTGDRLWFRETWVEHVEVWSGDGACPLLYRANDEHLLPAGRKWTPSIHMPRWAARYNPLNTGVRVEKLQSITEADAIAEGAHWMDFGKDKWGNQRNGWSMLTPHPGDPDRCLGSARYAFAAYINACSGGPNWNLKTSNTWDENPWVWVVSFEPLGVKP